MINNESSLNISAETFTSLLSAATYKLLIKKISHYRYINFNLILPFSAGFGSLAGGLSIHFFSEYFMPSGFHSNLWITWTLSSMIGILLIPNLNFRWKTLDIKAFFITQKKHFIELFFLIITTLIFTNLIYSNKITIINLSINFPYLLLPLIFWAAIRFNPVILSLLLFIETISILQYIKPVIGTNIESGFPYYSIINSFQIFILFTIEFSYLMAQIIVTRNLAQEKIKKLNENLEASVNRRTTELKQALEALGQSEEQFREAFETAMYGMALVRLDGSFIRVNQAFCDMIGYEKTKLISSNFQKITYKQDYNIERNKFRKLISGSIFFYQIEKQIIHSDQLAV
jgi:PAS domain-containing protein